MGWILVIKIYYIFINITIYELTQMVKDEQEFFLLKPMAVLRVIEDIKEWPASAQLHHNDFSPTLLLFLYGQKLHYVPVKYHC